MKRGIALNRREFMAAAVAPVAVVGHQAFVTLPVGTVLESTSWSGEFSSPAPGTRPRSFYVMPTGDDAADGSLAHPWRTMLRASGGMRDGDTVYVRRGHYDEDHVVLGIRRRQ